MSKPEPSELAQRILTAFTEATREEVNKHLKAGRAVPGTHNGQDYAIKLVDGKLECILIEDIDDVIEQFGCGLPGAGMRGGINE